MPKRSYSAAGSYRYGFNGKENDNDVKGLGNQQDYGMRIYDARVGRFLSVDPLQADYADLTPYQFAGNNPIQNVDLDGKEVYDFRLDLDDKGHTTGFSYQGQNKHGIAGWSIWNVFGAHIPAVDIYQSGKYLGRYSFNTESQGGFSTLASFAGNKEFRDAYIANNQSVEQAYHQIAADVAQTIEEGFKQAGVVRYAMSRTDSKPQSPADANKTILKQEAKAQSANGGTASSGAKKPESIGPTPSAGNNAAPIQKISAKLTTPQTGPEYYRTASEVVSNAVQARGKGITGTYDYVITIEYKLILGKGHYNLSGSASNVQAAGQIKLYNGQVKLITNNSGHYAPNTTETSNFGAVFQGAGLSVSGVKLQTFTVGSNTPVTTRIE